MAPSSHRTKARLETAEDQRGKYRAAHGRNVCASNDKPASDTRAIDRGNAPVLVFCDATRAFDNETRSFNDFTASAGHDDDITSCRMIGVGDDGALR